MPTFEGNNTGGSSPVSVKPMDVYTNLDACIQDLHEAITRLEDRLSGGLIPVPNIGLGSDSKEQISPDTSSRMESLTKNIRAIGNATQRVEEIRRRYDL